MNTKVFFLQRGAASTIEYRTIHHQMMYNGPSQLVTHAYWLHMELQ